VNYDDSMTINVNGGARGEGECPYSQSYCDQNPYWYGFAGSAGEVFLVSRLLFFYVCMSLLVSQLSSRDNNWGNIK